MLTPQSRFVFIVCGIVALLATGMGTFAFFSVRQQDRQQKLRDGWTWVDGNLVSPEQKIAIEIRKAQERERAEQERKKAEQLARQHQEQEKARAEAERQRQKTELERKDQEAIAKKAREMYGSYKESADVLADNILKVISATETGITYVKYCEMLQELQFSLNKVSMGRHDIEKGYSSYSNLSMAVFYLNEAKDWWKIKMDSDNDKYDYEMQAMWQRASAAYKAAMSDLAAGK